MPEIILESSDKKAFEELVDAIKSYGNNPQNFHSCMEINSSTDMVAICKIKNYCIESLGLVDVQISVTDDCKTTLKLIGYKHQKAQ